LCQFDIQHHLLSQPTPSTNRISTMSNSIDQPYINNVELHRPTMSTMSNSIDQPYINNVELHRPTVSTMSNSIDQPYINNVELHRPPLVSRWHRQSTMSNSIGSRTVCQVQQCRTLSTKSYHRHNGASINNVELRHGELSSCAKHTLNTCNLLSTRPRAASDSKKK